MPLFYILGLLGNSKRNEKLGLKKEYFKIGKKTQIEIIKLQILLHIPWYDTYDNFSIYPIADGCKYDKKNHTYSSCT